jgi:P27 family predicted phage terminase small subunit
MKGRKALPTSIKRAKGTLQKCREVDRPPEPTGELGAPPEWFADRELALWNKAVASAPDGVLVAGNESILATWVSASLAHDEARIMLQKAPSVYKDGKGVYKVNPFERVARDNALLMIRCAAELGFTPSSRGRINVAKKPQKPDNPFAKLIAINGGKK